jgi:two-component system phosphate regulon response regulator PhoB
LLELFLEQPGRVFSSVWGDVAEIDGRTRKALSHGRERDPIRTMRGTGYSFDETFGKS